MTAQNQFVNINIADIKNDAELWELVRKARHEMFSIKHKLEYYSGICNYGYNYTSDLSSEDFAARQYTKYKEIYDALEKFTNDAVDTLKQHNYNPRAKKP
ncbi:MAG: hypothetical protein MJZ25_08925 [Fibrobacter sp.]|nr:hypothetical protein [Fibrobacter sp.]